MGKLFGTDGVRGLANEYPMTPEIAMAIGRAVAHVLQNRAVSVAKTSLPIGLKPLESNRPVRRAKIVVGKDTRLSGYMIENALVAGICSMGADAIVIGPLPTPGVAFVTQSMRADAGIMISASHNAYHDNGIKIFAADGYKLPDEVEEEIEKIVLSTVLEKNRPKADLVGKAFRIEDAIGRYVVSLKAVFPKDLDLQGVRLALDCANGAGYKVAPMIFEELGAEVIRSGVSPNGLNINAKCGALHPEAVANQTAEMRADIGIALDGDGDRVILSDENGEIVDGDQIIGLCAIEMKAQGILKRDTVVTTPMSNIGLEVALRDKGIKLVRAQVGDRYVVELMRREGYNLGGEQSGHLVFLDHGTTGDGALAALKVLEVMRRSGKRLSELKKSIRLFPQVTKNVRVTKKPPLSEEPLIQEAIKKAETALKDSGRVFVRFSGTEPVCRVMIEGPDQQGVNDLADGIVQVIRSRLG
ncbi:MAG: phosphoglucosamine mutase [Bdellovibrionales bacterium]|nr:phosphoglucosamine mutase [Bdellovibrionales bacterium]